jgi:hypothetical protein
MRLSHYAKQLGVSYRTAGKLASLWKNGTNVFVRNSIAPMSKLSEGDPSFADLFNIDRDEGLSYNSKLITHFLKINATSQCKSEDSVRQNLYN